MSSIPWYEFNWLDYTMIAVVGLSVLVSFFRGFIKEALSLTVWAIGFALAFKFAPAVEKQIHQITHWEMLSYLVGFAAIFFGVWLLGMLLSIAIRSIVSRVGIGVGDRVIGMCFGAIRGLLLVSVMLMFVSMSPYKNSNVVHTSRLAPSFSRVVASLDKFVPTDIQRFTHWAMGGDS
jgi:membrane protein required for colicin V production